MIDLAREDYDYSDHKMGFAREVANRVILLNEYILKKRPDLFLITLNIKGQLCKEQILYNTQAQKVLFLLSFLGKSLDNGYQFHFLVMCNVATVRFFSSKIINLNMEFFTYLI